MSFLQDTNFISLRHMYIGGFAENQQIGGGGSCLVYRARVYGQLVAVKAMKEENRNTRKKSSSGKRQFMAELKLLTKVRHKNICRLLATSDDGPRRCLVLQLCPGGALNSRLQELSGIQRLETGVAIARALSALHSMTPPMIHRDVKTANVLIMAADITSDLDMTTCIKVSDFGTVSEDVRHRKLKELTTSSHNKDTHATTSHIIGTLPYMPNEYTLYGHVTAKTDAFAFGIVMMVGCVLEL